MHIWRQCKSPEPVSHVPGILGGGLVLTEETVGHLRGMDTEFIGPVGNCKDFSFYAGRLGSHWELKGRRVTCYSSCF